MTSNIKQAYALLILVIIAMMTACESEKPVHIDPSDPALNADWAQHGLNNAETRYSKLAQINSDTVTELSLAWSMELPEGRGQEATPIVIDRVMYTTAAWSHVFAIDPVSGRQIWHFDPQIDKSVAVKGCCGPVNRGVAYSNGKVFIGAYDGRLIALDAKSGELLWETQTVDTNKSYTITGAPRIANGKVFIGNGGAEFGVRGYVSAYDENTGEMVWRFYTVPGNPSEPQENPVHKTTLSSWGGEFWKLGGGGTVWDSMSIDAELNMLYVGVGNGSPWNPKIRSAGKGDNLFLSSIVALDIDTGEYIWHYQTTPKDSWDYTATQHMILTDLNIDGRERKVIMQAPKNGFFYVIDRLTGEMISAKNFVPVTWAKGIDEKGRPIINPEAEYWKSDKPTLVMPAWTGGHNWHPMSFSENTGLVYLPAHEMGFPYFDDKNFEAKQLAVNLGINVGPAAFPDNADDIEHIKELTKGHLAAWDPVSQKEVWRVQHAGPWNGGVLSTAGDVVFQGSAAGFLNAFHAKTGETLWSFPAQSGIVAPPITYAVDGKQYISVSVGWGGIFPLMTGPLTQISTANPINRSRLLTFSLDGTATLPPPAQALRKLPDLTSVTLDSTTVAKGHTLYERYCGGCHGTGAVGGGVVPDLRYSAIVQSTDAFQTIVGDGALAKRGMVGFSKELSSAQIDSIRQFIIDRNQFAHSINDTSRLSR